MWCISYLNVWTVMKFSAANNSIKVKNNLLHILRDANSFRFEFSSSSSSFFNVLIKFIRVLGTFVLLRISV